MNQNIWGPHFWETLHTITFNYPLKPSQKDKENYQNFFTSLKYVLPCSYCQKNYVRNMNELPIKLNNRKELVYWLIDLHNEVNGKEGKRQYTYEEIIKIYEIKYKKKIKLDNKDKCDDNNVCIYKHKYDYINMALTVLALMILLKIIYY